MIHRDSARRRFFPAPSASSSALHLGRVEVHGRGGEVLFQIGPALGAGDRHDVVAFVQQPGERDLPGLGALAPRRCRARSAAAAHIGVEVLALVARVDRGGNRPPDTPPRA